MLPEEGYWKQRIALALPFLDNKALGFQGLLIRPRIIAYTKQ